MNVRPSDNVSRLSPKERAAWKAAKVARRASRRAYRLHRRKLANETYERNRRIRAEAFAASALKRSALQNVPARVDTSQSFVLHGCDDPSCTGFTVPTVFPFVSRYVHKTSNLWARRRTRDVGATSYWMQKDNNSMSSSSFTSEEVLFQHSDPLTGSPTPVKHRVSVGIPTAAGYGADRFPSPGLQTTPRWDQLLFSARAQVQTDHISDYETFGEAHKTAEMLSDVVRGTARSVRDIKAMLRGDASAASRLYKLVQGGGRSWSDFRHHILSTSANGWMLWRYGVGPLVSDVEGAARMVSDFIYGWTPPAVRKVKSPKPFKYRNLTRLNDRLLGYHADPEEPHTWLVTARGRTHLKVRQIPREEESLSFGQRAAIITSPALLYGKRLSLGNTSYSRIDRDSAKPQVLASLTQDSVYQMAQAAWALMPVSFIVDWAINVADVLDDLTALQGWEVVEAYNTLQARSRTEWGSELSGTSVSHSRRLIDGNATIGLQLRSAMTSNRWTDLAALGYMVLGRNNRSP